jgi:lysozyme
MPMSLSPQGRAFLKGTEQLSLSAYPDGKNPDGSQKYSIGYGHSGAYEGQVISRTQAEALFDADALVYEAAVNAVCPHTTQQQFDALVSLAYNIGIAGFTSSTVARLHNAGNIAGAGDAFRMWDESDGGVNPVLVARRERERSLYLYGDVSGAPLGLVASPWAALGLAAAVAAIAYVALPRVPFVRRALA